MAHTFASVDIVRWPSDDGLSVEGLLIKPLGYMEAAGKRSDSLPLITFTHCGPAMAVLQTFIGYGSVCARFPLEIWAEKGQLFRPITLSATDAVCIGFVAVLNVGCKMSMLLAIERQPIRNFIQVAF